MNPHSVPNATRALPGCPDPTSDARAYEFDDGITRLVKWHDPSLTGNELCHSAVVAQRCEKIDGQLLKHAVQSGTLHTWHVLALGNIWEDLVQHGVASTKGAYNELAGSRLAQLLDAPVLRGTVVYVSGALVPADLKHAGEGFHFGVRLMPGVDFEPVHYPEIDNSAELPNAAVLLAWLNVGDQETKNQFLERGEKTKFRVIDLEYALGCPCWTPKGIATIHTTYELPVHLAERLTMESLQPAIDKLRSISAHAILECFMDCPERWNVSISHRIAGAKYAIAARDTIEQIIRAGNPGIT